MLRVQVRTFRYYYLPYHRTVRTSYYYNFVLLMYPSPVEASQTMDIYTLFWRGYRHREKLSRHGRSVNRTNTFRYQSETHVFTCLWVGWDLSLNYEQSEDIRWGKILQLLLVLSSYEYKQHGEFRAQLDSSLVPQSTPTQYVDPIMMSEWVMHACM